ncbi:sensor histidine kinase [Cryptosporangium aurantiacum]|uniref:histidine kinase n=1 Tax=Cryptosporangium aurantiacum TaxID=134849 RepID=A0A1M7J493_9ACTN|nr:ATP-binding protein [Cryptosporangium aurantiacum]SHM47217.1 osmosensitive K+ channel signal transduction histidine kinase [Cryptosporangium aurantiacum]
MARGTLRIYLGAAPGVGKTFKMLEEGRRRAERGADVVIGYVETHGRAETAAQIQNLEVVPRARTTYRGAEFEEMDLDAVLARRPEVALVDELAHTNVPGSRHAKRWQDVEALLDAGIEVVSTVNVQHLESVNDVVRTITGVPQRETVPDGVVRAADQVELVDMAPEALRRRMAHGNIYRAEAIDAALGNYFRVGNLTALRELALLWTADKVDEALRRYRDEHDIQGIWEARERVVVAVTGGPEGDTLIRRAARIAARSQSGDVIAVHVSRSDGLTGADPARLEQQRELVESLGGTFHAVIGDDVPGALLDFARGANATQLVLGTSRRPRWQRALSEGIGSRVIARSGPIDVHMVTHSEAARLRRLPGITGGLTARRRWYGFGLAVLGLPLLTVALKLVDLDLSSELLLFLGLVVAVALVGGGYPAVFAAAAGTLLVNWFFTPPVRTFTIAEFDNLVALTVFVLVALAVAAVVDASARRRREASRAQAEAEQLSALSRGVLAGGRALPALLAQVKDAFGQESVTLLERADGRWNVVDSVGPPGETGDVDIPVDETLHLVLRGRPLPASDRRVLAAFAAQAAIALRQSRLSAQAAEAARLAEGNRMRTALLAAVSHDLRTPLASIKAAISALRMTTVTLEPDDVAELHATIDESADQLVALIDNLLDMSRLQTGAVDPLRRVIGLDEVVPRAVADGTGGAAEQITVDVPETLPAVLADPGLLERAVANLVSNAVRHGAGAPIVVRASALGDRVELRVVDTGPGVPEADRDRIFAPFQRLGDRPMGNGVGLGLAVARGFVEAMGGTLEPEDTPGGGLTMVVSLEVAR